MSAVTRRTNWLNLAIFLLVVIVGGGLIGASNVPGEWYQWLQKPPFNPPNWVFAPVWLALYVLIAIAGWRIWERAPKSLAMQVWFAVQALNWLWSPVFFTYRQLWIAAVIIVAMWALILAFILLSQRIDRAASRLFWPYLVWVSFATLLNISVAWLN